MNKSQHIVKKVELTRITSIRLTHFDIVNMVAQKLNIEPNYLDTRVTFDVPPRFDNVTIDIDDDHPIDVTIESTEIEIINE